MSATTVSLATFTIIISAGIAIIAWRCIPQRVMATILL